MTETNAKKTQWRHCAPLVHTMLPPSPIDPSQEAGYRHGVPAHCCCHDQNINNYGCGNDETQNNSNYQNYYLRHIDFIKLYLTNF